MVWWDQIQGWLPIELRYISEPHFRKRPLSQAFYKYKYYNGQEIIKQKRICLTQIYSKTIPLLKLEGSKAHVDLSIITTKRIGVTFHPGDMYVLLPKCLMYTASNYFMTTPSSVCTAMQRKICVFTKVVSVERCRVLRHV